MRIKMQTFKKLLPEAGVIKYDVDTKIVEADGKIIDFSGIDLEKEFLKTEEELKLLAEQEATETE
jgi:hypothetical protein